MNERIRELAEQAFFDSTTSQPSDKMYTFSDHKMQKFAELIVRECADFVDSEIEKQDEMPCVYGDQIKQHFGVE